MSYAVRLPAAGLVFVVTMTDEAAIEAARFLIGHKDGSSFAVTADSKPGFKNFYMSSTSSARYMTWREGRTP